MKDSRILGVVSLLLFGVLAVILIVSAGYRFPAASSSAGNPAQDAVATVTPTPPYDVPIDIPTAPPGAVGTGEPTFIAPPPVPTTISPTPLPTPRPGQGGWRSENIRVGAPVEFGRDLRGSLGRPAWSPVGDRIAIAVPTGELITWETSSETGETARGETPITNITLVDIPSGRQTPLVRGSAPMWSPDGRLIAYYEYSGTIDELHIEIVDVETQQITQVATLYREQVSPTLVWASATELLYYDDQPLVFDTATSQSYPLLDAATLAASDPARGARKWFASAPAAGVVAVSGGGETLFLEWQPGAPRLIGKIPEGTDNMAISPDGQLLAYVCSSSLTGEIQLCIHSIWDDTVLVELPPLGYHGLVSSISWAPDSASLIYTAFAYNQGWGLWIVNRDGSGLRLLGENLPEARHGLWSPRGDTILMVHPLDGGMMVLPVSKNS